MTLEIFYPVELKKVIRELREQNDLNERAVKSLDHTIILFYFCALFISLVLLYDSSPRIAWSVSLTLFLITTILSFIAIRWHYFNQMKPYLKGEKMMAKVIELYGTLTPQNTYAFKVYIPELHQEMMTSRHFFLNKDKLPRKGQTIEIMYSPDLDCKPILNIPVFRSDNCLSKKLLKP